MFTTNVKTGVTVRPHLFAVITYPVSSNPVYAHAHSLA